MCTEYAVTPMGANSCSYQSPTLPSRHDGRHTVPKFRLFLEKLHEDHFISQNLHFDGVFRHQYCELSDIFIGAYISRHIVTYGLP